MVGCTALPVIIMKSDGLLVYNQTPNIKDLVRVEITQKPEHYYQRFNNMWFFPRFCIDAHTYAILLFL